MKKIFFLLCSAVLLISIKSKAQITIGDFQNMSVEAKSKLVTDSMKTMLNLTDAQYPKVFKANYKGISQATVVKKSPGGRFSKGKELKNIFTSYKSSMKSILTSQQQELLKAKVKNMISYYKGQAKNMPFVINVPE